MFWVLNRFAPALEARRAGFLDGRHAPAMFAMRDLRKDLGFAVELFGQSGAPTPVTRLSGELVNAAAETMPDDDISAVIQPYRAAHSSSRGMATAPVMQTAR